MNAIFSRSRGHTCSEACEQDVLYAKMFCDSQAHTSRGVPRHGRSGRCLPFGELEPALPYLTTLGISVAMSRNSKTLRIDAPLSLSPAIRPEH